MTVSDMLKPPERDWHPPRISFEHDLSNLPIPRLRWTWSEPERAYITVELAVKYGDAVVGMTVAVTGRAWRVVDYVLRKVGR